MQDPVDSGQSPCDERARRLAQEIYAHPGAVTAVARFDYSTYEPLGFEIFAGPYSAISEAEARVRAQTDTGFGTGGGLVGSGDPFVFYQSPGDFGGVGVVSQRTGLSVFGGEIVWDGRGEISYPSSWRPASELRTRCTSSGGLGPSVSGWNLATSSAIQEAELAPVLDRIRETVIPAAIWFGGYVFDTKVILYPRSVGAFDPSSAEWIVFVNGGWLE
ncbi:MAG: hypothetical protein HY791_01580 [Deltaproteobacteria bacterium]|nr:hypothetical protein [Deltaproteobacteria bacterium]